MSDNSAGILGLGLGFLAVLFILCLILALYVFLSFCFKLICEKTGKTPGVLIWIPIARYVPLLQVAELPEWLVILFLVPLVNIVVFFVLWFKVCEARGKSGWLVLLFLVPIANLMLIPYLAFTE